MNNIYLSETYSTNCIRARKLENESKWEEARSLRIALGHMEDVAAIDMIIEATRLGDEFRRLTAGLYEQWENHVINNYQLHVALTEAHEKVYGKK